MGRRRASHLNPGHVVVDSGSGYERVCKLTLDSRFLDGGISPVASPTDLTGCKLWLAGDDYDGDGTWPDGSGEGNDGTQTTPDYKPSKVTNELNGHAVVRLDGNDDCLACGSQLTMATAFVVSRYSGGSTFNGYSCVLHHNNIYTNEAFLGASGTTSWYGLPVTAHTSKQNTVVSENFAPLASFKLSSIEIFDHLADGDIAVGTQVGFGRFWNGDIAEIIVYDRLLSLAERKRVEAYLNSKYALWSDPAITDPITTWGDRSDLGNDATGSGTARPTLQVDTSGRKVVRFDGNDKLSVTFSSAAIQSVVVVAKVSNPTAHYQQLLSGNSDAGNFDFSAGNDTAGCTLYSGNALAVPFSTSDMAITTGVFNGSSSAILRNGVVKGTGNAGSNISTAFVLGGRWGTTINYFGGDVAALAIVATISDALRRRIENVLARAFKLQTA